MRVAIDKNVIKQIKDFTEFEYIYVYENEEYEELKKLNLHCIHKDYINNVDINLTDYNIPCLRKNKVTDKDWKKPIAKKDYKFAIIVPNYNNDRGDYNGKTFLQNCIESILNQTYKNFELIIVDDCSTDTSVETVDNYVDNRIHLIKNRRKRYNGGSRNVGIDYALDNLDFDYFCFLDSDDWWKNEKVLETINNRLYNHEMAIIGAEMLFKDGVKYKTYNEWQTYEDFFMSIGKTTLWCTAWCRIIRKDKIVYFPEGSLMEDRTWSYEQADNVDINNVTNIKEILYVWNRMNTTNSVSIVRNKIWEASAWKHVGQQLMLIERLKHKEMIPIIEKRIKVCIDKLNHNIYQQY